jgi:lipopolysaccharide heptosyltransferase III
VGPAPKIPATPRILVVTTRRLGDVLLTTPLVRALRRGLPGARVDMLVFRGTEGILAGNPDIDRVIAIPLKPSTAEMTKLIYRLWRRYDIAVSTQTGDRPTLLAVIAGRFRIGLIAKSKSFWKSLLLNRSVASNSELHRVDDLLQLAAALGIHERPDVVLPKKQVPRRAPSGEYAVLHANPKYHIRRWTDAGWRALAEGLSQRGLAVVVTGGPAPDEKEYLDRLWNPVRPPVERMDGQLEWGELAQLLSGAAVYVGPDTSMTHLAAAAGCPTVAIYGPASPHGMGPWPVGGLDRPWARAGTIQNRGNVWVVQNPLPCMPCDRLGCDNHLQSRSQCLDELPARQVLLAVDQALGRVAATPSALPAGLAGGDKLPLTLRG